MNQAQRVLKIIKIMAGNEFTGIRNKEIARTLGANPATVSRDLHLMIEAGYVELSGDLYYLTPAVVKIGLAHMEHMKKQEMRFQEISERYGT